jgi:hypothetical protein
VHLALAIFYADVMKKRKNKNNGQNNNGRNNNGRQNNGDHKNAPPHDTHPKEHKESKDVRMERELENLRRYILAVKSGDESAIANMKLSLKSDGDGLIKRREVQNTSPHQPFNKHKLRIEKETDDLRSMVVAQERHVKSEIDGLDLTLKNSIVDFDKYTAENEAKKAEADIKREQTGRDVPIKRSEKELISMECELNNVRLALLSQISEDKTNLALYVARIERDSTCYNTRKVDLDKHQKIEMNKVKGGTAYQMQLSDKCEDAYTSDEESDDSDCSSCDE